MESSEDSGPTQDQQQQQQPAKSFSQSYVQLVVPPTQPDVSYRSHVRSRITVVCAEVW